MPEKHKLRHVLVATDFQECSREAVSIAADLARANNEELVVVHSFEPPSYSYSGLGVSMVETTTAIQKAAHEALDRVIEALRGEGVHARGILKCGPAWEQILEAAKEEQVDLIVLGTHGRRGLSRALLGSVAEKIVRLSTLPVLTIPARP